MRLIEFTLDYPYGAGETFCEDELKIAQQRFDEVVVVSCSGHFDKSGRGMPNEIKLVNARKKRYELIIILYAIASCFSFRFFKEYIFAKKILRVSTKKIIFSCFIYFYYSFLVKRSLKELNIDNDILYSYWMAGSAYGLVQVKRKYENALYISRTHRFDCFIEREYQPFRREIIDGLDLVVSISEAGKDSIQKNLIKYTVSDGNKVKVNRLGVRNNSKKLNPSESNTPYTVLVTCSNINLIKRLDIIIDALLLCKSDIEWIHFGGGEYEGEIKKYAKKLDKSTNIKYSFEGKKSNEEILLFYSKKHIDLFVNCSDSEGIPFSIMEAMSFGIPVIARDVGGNREIVGNDNGRLLSDQASPKELASAIEEFIFQSDKELLRRGSYNTYINKYNADINYNIFFDDLIKLCKEKV